MGLISIPANPVPEGATVISLTTQDGVSLRAARWEGRLKQRGTVAILTGRAEFIERYFETIAELLARGFAVVALDWRGQGAFGAPAPQFPQGPYRRFRNLRARSHRRARADPRTLLSQALVRARPQHGRRGADRASARRPLTLHPARPDLADDRSLPDCGSKPARGSSLKGSILSASGAPIFPAAAAARSSCGHSRGMY